MKFDLGSDLDELYAELQKLQPRAHSELNPPMTSGFANCCLALPRMSLMYEAHSTADRARQVIRDEYYTLKISRLGRERVTTACSSQVPVKFPPTSRDSGTKPMGAAPLRVVGAGVRLTVQTGSEHKETWSDAEQYFGCKEIGCESQVSNMSV